MFGYCRGLYFDCKQITLKMVLILLNGSFIRKAKFLKLFLVSNMTFTALKDVFVFKNLKWTLESYSLEY